MTDNIGHLATHSVSVENIWEVLSNRPRFFRNLPGRGGSHVMLGPNTGGRYYYVSLVQIGAGTWSTDDRMESVAPASAHSLQQGVDE
jgi:hypothetical protein